MRRGGEPTRRFPNGLFQRGDVHRTRLETVSLAGALTGLRKSPYLVEGLRVPRFWAAGSWQLSTG